MNLISSEISPNIEKKLDQLQQQLRSLGRLLVAFSGGVDSTFLLGFAAHHHLPVTAVIGDSPSLPRRELEEALAFLQQNSLPHLIVCPRELEDGRYSSNPENRCFFCKQHLFSEMKELLGGSEFDAILDGTNADDLKGHRPGRRAAGEAGVFSPLADCQLTKEEIRLTSRLLGLPTWNKPEMACLSSRFPTGEAITAAKLSVVEKSEQYLRSLGFAQVRVRSHENQSLARIEVLPAEIPRLVEMRAAIETRLKEYGFTRVAVDLSGYRR